jgi:hypothetical protein
MNFKNTFGAAADASGIDLQRVDLWKVTLTLPQMLQLDWKENVEFALEKFPFPSREREMIGVKYMQQTNFVIGGDTPTSAIEIPIRYAFQARTAEALEKWNYLCANPQTGGVGLTSACKSKGFMRWMVPNMQKQVQDIRRNAIPNENTMDEGLTYVLEGCIIKGLKYSDADMTQSNHVNLLFSLQIDRYYPENVQNMVVVASR